jgi:hypothetical protein
LVLVLAITGWNGIPASRSTMWGLSEQAPGL